MEKFSEFLLSEQNKKLPEVTDVDVDMAIDRGLNVFWREIRMSFPNAKSKDLMPDMADKFRSIAKKSVEAWLRAGSDMKIQPGSVSYSSFNRNPNAIQTLQWNIQ